MCINCKVQKQGGDMASRMGICNDTNKPVAYFENIALVIEQGAELLCISEEKSTMIAYKFLKRKNGNGTKIYFCEDKFKRDLETHYINIFLEKEPDIRVDVTPKVGKRVITGSTPIDKGNWFYRFWYKISKY